MPNWVKNIVRVSEDTMQKIKNEYFTNGSLDFNKIIPMPKSLMLTCGTITEMAIFYAYTKKDEKGKKEIVDILKNKNEYCYKDYWRKIKSYNDSGHFENIEEFAKKYVPEDMERELNIKTLEELGDTYISNIKNYGSDTWYDWCCDHWGTKWNASQCEYDNNTIIFETAWATPEPIFKKLSELFPKEIIQVDYADECYSNANNGKLFYQDGECIDYIDLDENFAANVWNEEINKDIYDLILDKVSEYFWDNEIEDLMDFGSDIDGGLHHFSIMYKEIMEQLDIEYENVYTEDLSDGKYLTTIVFNDNSKLEIDTSAWNGIKVVTENMKYIYEKYELVKTKSEENDLENDISIC